MRVALRACSCIASYKPRRARAEAMPKLSFNGNGNGNGNGNYKATQQQAKATATMLRCSTQPPAQAKPFPPLKKGG